MDSSDWSNGIRYRIFYTRPDTEFKARLLRSRRPSCQVLEQIFARYDGNGNGRLSFDEFVECVIPRDFDDGIHPGQVGPPKLKPTLIPPDFSSLKRKNDGLLSNSAFHFRFQFPLQFPIAALEVGAPHPAQRGERAGGASVGAGGGGGGARRCAAAVRGACGAQGGGARRGRRVGAYTRPLFSST